MNRASRASRPALTVGPLRILCNGLCTAQRFHVEGGGHACQLICQTRHIPVVPSQKFRLPRPHVRISPMFAPQHAKEAMFFRVWPSTLTGVLALLTVKHFRVLSHDLSMEGQMSCLAQLSRQKLILHSQSPIPIKPLKCLPLWQRSPFLGPMTRNPLLRTLVFFYNSCSHARTAWTLLPTSIVEGPAQATSYHAARPQSLHTMGTSLL